MSEETSKVDSLKHTDVRHGLAGEQSSLAYASVGAPHGATDSANTRKIEIVDEVMEILLTGSSAQNASGSVETFNVPGPIGPGFKLKFTLFAQWGSILMTAVFDGTSTTVSFVMQFVGDTRTVNVVFDGNPFGYPRDKVVTICDINGSTGYQGALTAVACYLAGTLIETPTGPVPVETLSVGDKVLVYRDEDVLEDTLCWVGNRTIYAYSDGERPVRIRAHALAENIPSSDLLITPEHCLLLEEHFIPVRMLVNGSSIVIEPGDNFDVYHIETERHSIVKANGAYAETFLDTGHRSGFTQRGDIVGISPKTTKHWMSDAAAPLGTNRALVEPIYQTLCARARELDMASQCTPPASVTDNPDLFLEIGREIFIRPLRRTDKGYVFELPAGVRAVWICSRVGKPSVTIGPFVDDRRALGVLIGDVTVYGSRGTREVRHHLAQEPLDGWHNYENSYCRWTAGRALLELDGVCDTSPSMMMLTILAAGPYLESLEEADIINQVPFAIAS